MNKDSHMKAYITGFILSLIFTAIPFYMVQNKTAQGSQLIVAIMVFAVLQMLVQIIFFLHLGRNPKLRWQLGFFGGTVFGIIVVVGGSIIIMNHLHRNMTPKELADKAANDEAVHQLHGEQVGTCPGGTGKVHMIELKDNAASPAHTDAKLCDTIIIYNADGEARDIEFGVHDHHVTYAGGSGKELRPGRNLVINLTETGTTRFHDHILDELSGDFTVTP